MHLGDYSTSATPSGSQTTADISHGSRRISTRSIKRKKFDDELVESSLIKSERARPKLQVSGDSKPIAVVGSSSTTLSQTGERPDGSAMQPSAERRKVHKVAKLSIV